MCQARSNNNERKVERGKKEKKGKVELKTKNKKQKNP